MVQEAEIRVVIVDDYRLFREVLCTTLRQTENIKIVGEAWDAKQGILIMADLKPDIALISTVMQETDLLELIKITMLKSPKTKIIILRGIPGIPNESIILKAILAGAKGYISNGASLSDLIKAIKAVHQGEIWLERKMIGKFFEGNTNSNFKPLDGHRIKINNDSLTSREREVLSCLARGFSNKEIGKSLCISEKTVKCHVNHIFGKIHVNRRPQAILYAIKQGFTRLSTSP